MAEAIRVANAAEEAFQTLCRATLHRPTMTPADVDEVLASLAGALGALPQACNQIGEILHREASDQVLEMDSMTDTDAPTLAIDTARLQLAQV